MKLDSAPRPSRFGLRGLDVAVTERCNLSCAYCYQRRRGRADLSPAAARAVLDRVRTIEESPATLAFTGGEPLLNVALVRWMTETALAENPEGRALRFEITTNGTLVDDDILAFLVHHGFRVSLSFDGSATAQDRRAPGSQPRLAALVSRLARELPNADKGALRVQMVLDSGNVASLAEGVALCGELGANDVRIGPLLVQDEQWTAAHGDELETQMDRIVDDAVALFHESGRIPFAFFRGSSARDEQPGTCGAARLTSLAVDARGRAWGCGCFAPWSGDLTPLARESARWLDLGPIASAALPARVGRARRRLRRMRILDPHAAHRPTSGSCTTCSARDSCFICPFTLAMSSSRQGPLVAPHPACALVRAVARARSAFLARTAEARLRARMAKFEQHVLDVASVLKEKSGALPTPEAPPAGGREA